MGFVFRTLNIYVWLYSELTKIETICFSYEKIPKNQKKIEVLSISMYMCGYAQGQS